MKDVMIDLETFGTGKDACIVQIGACYFDKDTGEIGRKFKINVDAASCVREGSKIDADTVYWWLSQSQEAIASITAYPKETLRTAFLELNAFLDGAERIWSHATFDFVIISETFRRLAIKPTFSYRAARDIRTLVALADVNSKSKPQVGVAHDALDDAIYQVGYCVEAINKLKGLFG